MMFDHGMAANTKTPPASHMSQKARRERGRGLALGSFLFVVRLALEDASVEIDITAIEARQYCGSADITRPTAGNPQCAASYLSLAQTLSRSGKSMRALIAFQHASALAPNDVQTLVGLSDCHRQLGEHVAAIDVLTAALKIKPKHAGLLTKVGDVLVGENPEQALTFYREAAASNPSSPYPYLGMSTALMELGQFDHAIMELDNAEGRCGSQPALVIHRSELTRRIGRTDLAREILRSGSVNHPESVWLRIKELQMELAFGELTRVAKELAQLEPQTIRERGLWHFCQGQIAETEWRLIGAINEYSSAVALTPDEPWFHHELARVNLLCLEFDAARKHLAEYTVLSARNSGNRRSTNVSQTHLGQVLNEFLLDASLIAEIRGTAGLGESERIRVLANIVAAHPDSTVAAVMFLIAVHQVGLLCAIQKRGRSSIPRTLVQYWDTPDIPPDIAELMTSWRERHPDFDYRLFNDDSARCFIRGHCSPDVYRA